MRMRNFVRVVAGVAALAVGGAVLGSDDHDQARALLEKGEIVALEQVLAAAKEHYPGRVLEAELERERGRYLYEIKIAGDDGKVRELKYDAGTAKLVADELED